ncbi:glucose-1-phosphate adenylyltransferase subunit GlgD [Sporolactobacillus laevolacticus]|uniref:glucose-1-phosphate adenylyltransferase subunit GlgD n=1 Tax=Sporolactobacillus laevolacticus TaxID=33018 RepID=UPI0025B3D5C2|nr:glucose-1-phosphate adenylyltransferase subunit GlgD [Sporolactobacillus laevolacticus]MDN3956259.1 glucose-1-phosphate adenylyltransferase subunit GlgD [Sporolactobacillus laevolacticus]
MMKHQNICGIINLNESINPTQPLTAHRPVAGLPFCGRYRLIDFPLSNLASAHVESIGIFMNNQYRSIYDHVRSGSDWDMDRTNGGLFFFSPEVYRTKPGMTNEDLANYYNNLEFIEKSGADYVLVMGSRTLCNLDVRAILRHHLEQNAEITVVYKTVHRLAIDGRPMTCVVLGEDGKVRSIMPCSTCHDDQIAVNMEIYFMKCSLFAKLIRRFIAWNELYNLRDALHQAVTIVSTNGYEYTGYLKTIQSIKSYYDGNMDMLEESNLTALLGGNHRIQTKVKNEVPAFYGKNADVTDALIANGCVIKGKIVRSLLSRNVTVAKGAEVKGTILMEGCMIGEGAYLENVIMDKETRVAPGSQLIGSKEHPIVVEKKSKIHLGQ